MMFGLDKYELWTNVAAQDVFCNQCHTEKAVIMLRRQCESGKSYPLEIIACLKCAMLLADTLRKSADNMSKAADIISNRVNLV